MHVNVNSEQEAMTTSLLSPGTESRPLISRQWNSRPQWFLAICAAVGTMAMGAILGWSSPALPRVKDEMNVTEEESSWVSSIVAIGAIVGGPLGGISSDRFGRRGSLIIWSVPATIGWFMIFYSEHVFQLYTGRLILGVYCGAICVFVPTFIGECARPEIRGALATVFQVMVSFGILFSYVVGCFVDWRWLSVFCAFLPIVNALLMLVVPESPLFLLQTGKDEEAEKALQWLRGRRYLITQELSTLRRGALDCHQTEPLRFPQDFLTRPIYLPLLLSVIIVLNQQVSGVNAILFYTEDIFTKAGSSIDPSTCVVIIGAVQLIATIAGVPLVDRAGRRVLLMVSNLVAAFALVGLGLFFYEYHYDPLYATQTLAFLPVLSLCVYITAFSLGLGPIPWVLTGELFSPRVKGVGSGIATVTSWGIAFLITKTFPALSTTISSEWIFWTYAACCGGGFVFTAFFLPETKGRTLDEIQAHFGHIEYQSVRTD